MFLFISTLVLSIPHFVDAVSTISVSDPADVGTAGSDAAVATESQQKLLVRRQEEPPLDQRMTADPGTARADVKLMRRIDKTLSKQDSWHLSWQEWKRKMKQKTAADLSTAAAEGRHAQIESRGGAIDIGNGTMSSPMDCKDSDKTLAEFSVRPGYDRSRPLVTGMAANGIGNRIAQLISHITVAEVLKRPLYVMWNVSVEGTDDIARQRGLWRGKLHAGQTLAAQNMTHGGYDWYTFRQSLALPHAMPMLLDEVTNMTDHMFNCIATIGSRSNASSNTQNPILTQGRLSADLQPTSIVLPVGHNVPPHIQKEVIAGTGHHGDQYPGLWLTRMERYVKFGTFVQQAEWNAAVPNGDAFMKAYDTVASQFGPSLFLQACLPEPKTYAVVHIRCQDFDGTCARKGVQAITSIVDKLREFPLVAKSRKWLITSNSAALQRNAEGQFIQALGASYLVHPSALGTGTCLHEGKLDVNTFEAMRDYFSFKRASMVLSPLGSSSISASATYAGGTPLFLHPSEFENWLRSPQSRQHKVRGNMRPIPMYPFNLMAA